MLACTHTLRKYNSLPSSAAVARATAGEQS